MGNLTLEDSEGGDMGEGLVEREVDETHSAVEGESEDTAGSESEEEEPMWVLRRGRRGRV